MKFAIYPSAFLALIFVISCQSKTAQEAQQEISSALGAPLSEEEILNESEEAFDARMEWWRDAKFGMFIH